ncbi:MAG: DUF3592 domain-containing protein [Salinarimonadaceae bacterium]|nr:MAG: DUF3592 domain-containing protein [Salinarimonadaceae bacterium]
MFQRIQHFFNTLSTNWSEDPGARGAAKMAAGGVLVAEGVFGVVRSRRGRNGNRQRGGILGGIFGIVFGVIFIHIGGFLESTNIQDPVETTGEIIASERAGTSGDNNQQMYRARIAYEVDGERYEFTTRGRQSWQPTVGAEVTVAYSASNPSNAHQVGGVFDWGIRAFSWAGWFVVITSVFSLLISIALIAFGIWLFQQGRADRRLSGEDRSFFGDLFAIAKDVRSGNMDVSQTAAGMSGAGQGAGGWMGAAMGAAGMGSGSGTAASTHAPPQPQSNAESTASASAPPGWMLDPDDERMLRWWNGRTFTEQRRPRD